MADRINVNVPEPLRRLTEQLASLPVGERELVISAARRREDNPSNTLSWGDVWKAKGVVHIGGDAVADCEALYDNA